MKHERDLKVETLRGIAIILVVFTHVVGGLRFPSDSIWNYVSSSLQFLRMPLFTVISGYVYAYRPLTKGNEIKFLRGKSRRLLITFLILTPLYFIFRVIFPTNFTPELNNIFYVYVYPKAGLWYLQALFIIFIVVTVLEYFKAISNLHSLFKILMVSFLIFIIYVYIPNEFSLRGAVYLLPYFLYGIGLNRFKKSINRMNLNLVFIILFAISFSLLEYNIITIFAGNTAYNYKFSLIPVLAAISIIFLLFKINFKSKPFIWLGNYSYSIFLYHAIFCVSSRILLGYADIQNSTLMIIGCVLPGLLFPIFLEHLLTNNSVLGLLFLGKYKKSKYAYKNPIPKFNNVSQ